MHDHSGPGASQPRSLQFLLEQRWLHFLLLACLMTTIAQGLSGAHWRWGDFVDNLVLDESFRLRGAVPPATVAETLPYTKNIKIIELQHSLPRPILAKLLAKLSQAKVVALDLMLVDNEAGLTPTEKPWYRGVIGIWRQDDKTLSQQLRANHNVVLGLWPEMQRVADSQHPGGYVERRAWEKPAPALWQSARYHAHLWVQEDAQDGIARTVPLFENTPTKTPSLDLAIAAAASDISPQELASLTPHNGYLPFGQRRIPLDANGNMRIDYVGPRQCFEYLSNRVVYDEALDNYDAADFAHSIVLVGETDYKAKDTFTTPFGDMAGVQVHANIVATLLSPQGPPTVMAQWQLMLLALVCSALLVVPLLRLSLWSSLLFAVLQVACLGLGASWMFIHWHQILPVSVPMIAVALTYNAIALYEYGRARSTLGKFIGREMVPRTLNMFNLLRLGGRVEEASAFFCDLRGYSTLSEHLPAETVTDIVNEYTQVLGDVIAKHRGRIIDYFGDGVFVIFEPSLAGPNHALKAVQAALETQQVLIARQPRWTAKGAPKLEAGIAIHTGRMVIGVVGAQQHMKLGAVGDAVNIAARVQGLSAQLGYPVLITSQTHDFVKDKITVVSCGSFPVKGRQEPVEVYGVELGAVVAAPSAPKLKVSAAR